MNTDNAKKDRPLFPHEIPGQQVSNIDTPKLIKGYADVFLHHTDQELVDQFNGLVGRAYNSIWLQALRAALIGEFENRSIDIAAIATKVNGKIQSVSYAHAMKLVTNDSGKELVRVGASH